MHTAKGLLGGAVALSLLACGDLTKNLGSDGPQAGPQYSVVALDGAEWELQVDRVWDHVSQVQFPADPLSETDYQSTTAGATYRVVLSADGQSVEIGAMPFRGQLSTDLDGKRTYDFQQGTLSPPGGRFAVWTVDKGFQAELTLYGSGVPIINSERGALVAPSTVVDFITNVSAPANDLVTVSLQSHAPIFLDVTDPSTRWRAESLESWRQLSMLMFFKIAPDERVIVSFLTTMTGTIMAMDSTDDAEEVGLNEYQAINFLKRSNPNFQQYFDALLNAQQQGHAILVTTDYDNGHEVIDVRPTISLRSSDLILEPDSIEFFTMIMNAPTSGFVFSGYDATHRVCATILFSDSVYDATATIAMADFNRSPEVFLLTNAESPCSPDFSGGTAIVGAAGWADFAERTTQQATPVHTMLDASVTFAAGSMFASLTATNRSILSPAPVVFGIEFLSDVTEDFFVQTITGSGYPGWVSIRHANGDPVSWFFDCCTCGSSLPEFSNLTGGTEYDGSIYLTWYGDEYAEACEATRSPVEAGNYVATFCYGYQLEDGGAIVSPTCEERAFSYPQNQEVVLQVNHGG